MSNVIAIVLGGGAGTRLAPLTEKRAKPAVPIAGKYRLVDIPISNCFNSEIDRIFVLTQFNSASLNSHIKNTYKFSMFTDSFVEILAAEQTPVNPTWFQGTADAVRQSMNHFTNHSFDYALILSGDQLYQMDFKVMLEAHIENKADVSIATLPVNTKDASEFGILKTDSEGMVRAFVEKPGADILENWKSDVSEEMFRQGKHYLASMGIYIFNREFLLDLLNHPEKIDFGKHIIPNIVGKKKILSFPHEGYWTDIGNIESFHDANLGLTDDVPQFNLFDSENKIYTRARILPPSKYQGTTITKAIIADGCIINAKEIERSIIGNRSRIGKGTVIKNSYIMGNDFYQKLTEIEADYLKNREIIGVGEQTFLNNVIADKNVRIGNNVYINGGTHLEDANTELFTIKKGIVVIKSGVTIPDGFRIE